MRSDPRMIPSLSQVWLLYCCQVDELDLSRSSSSSSLSSVQILLSLLHERRMELLIIVLIRCHHFVCAITRDNSYYVSTRSVNSNVTLPNDDVVQNRFGPVPVQAVLGTRSISRERRTNTTIIFALHHLLPVLLRFAMFDHRSVVLSLSQL